MFSIPGHAADEAFKPVTLTRVILTWTIMFVIFIMLMFEVVVLGTGYHLNAQ